MKSKDFSLFLMSRKGLVAIKDLVSAGYSDMIDMVVISHDYNVLNDYYDEIKKVCQIAAIPVYDRKEMVSIKSKYCIAISWRWMIKLNDITKLIVFHDSILPRYRGFSPLVNMLINKEPYVGVTALFASNEYDKGDIIDQKKRIVSYPIRISDAIDLITPLYSQLICNIFKKIKNNEELVGTPQVENHSSYSVWRDEDDYRIDWHQSSEEIQQFVYCVGYPFKGASSLCDASLVRILDCELVDDVKIENRTPGKVIFMDGMYPIVICGQGLLKLKKVYSEDGLDLLPLKKFRTRFE